jgi:tRNA threonylcarbamoyladenosine biosynthesis protein TsaB
MVLACDTSTAAMHLALCRFEEGTLTWFETLSLLSGNRHSELLMDKILALCADAGIRVKEIDLLVTGAGPGSFTGLRISMATLKGISLAASIPLVSVPSLDVWYHSVEQVEQPVLTVIDAKKQRFYTALHQRGERLLGPADLTVEELEGVIAAHPDLLLTGADASTLLSRLGRTMPLLQCEGASLALTLARMGVNQYLSQGADAPDSGPFYIRKSDAELALQEKEGLKEQ